MPVIGTRSFKGEIPRVEPYLLGDTNAQYALDCDFANGSLKPLQAGFLLRAMANNPVRGIYTEDGANFYTWAAETIAYQSPVIDDSFNRMYYLTPSEGIFRVANKLGMAFNGPTPQSGNIWKAGVPRPTVAPVLSVVDRYTMPDYPSYTVTAESWWTDTSGISYNRGAATLGTVKALNTYTVSKATKPTPPEGTTMTYKLWVKLLFTNVTNNTEIMSATVSSAATAKSNALPGSVEFTLDENSAGSSCTVSLKWGTSETRAYTYVFKNTWEEEGAPAPAATISVTYLQDVRIEMQDPASMFANYRPYSATNVYRTFGTSGTYIRANVEYQGNTLAFEKVLKPLSGGEALQSTNWTPPPDGLQGLEISPNGWFLAFKGNTLYMAEPYRPHAWPYNMTFRTAIRGVRTGQQSIVVTTADGVYVVTGAMPSAAQQVKLSSPQPGIAQRSMANIDGAVAYASNDGFVLVNGASAETSVSQQLFDRKTWRNRYGNQLTDASMRFAYHDGALVSSSSVEANGFLLRMDDDAGSFTRLSSRYDSMFMLPVNDALYYSSGASVYQFRGGTAGTFVWKSKEYIFPAQVTFGAGYIRCDGNVTMELYAEDVLVATKTLTSGHFRLKDNLPRKLRWSYKLTGTGVVYEIQMARSMQELKDV